LAHFALPVVIAPGVGAMTAPDLVSQLGLASSISLAPLFALLAVGAGAWLYRVEPAPSSARWGGYGLLACAGLTTLCYLASLPALLALVGLPDLSEIDTFVAFLGPGFWIVSLGIAAQAVGGVLVFVAGRSEPPIRSEPSTGP
jgi:hypothetical protein